MYIIYINKKLFEKLYIYTFIIQTFNAFLFKSQIAPIKKKN